MENYKNKYFVKIGLVMMVFVMIFCLGIKGSFAAEKIPVLIGTAAIGAAFYPVGVGMAEVINKHLPGYSSICQITGGAVANLRLLDKKQITVGFSGAEFFAAALKGEKPYDKILNVLPIMHVGFFPIQFVTLKKSNIKTLYDCKGKKIAIGTPGASTNVNAKAVLKAHGIGENEFKPFYMGYSEAADALGDGIIDVLVDPGVMPSPSTESLFSLRSDVVLVTGDPAVLEKANLPGSVLYKVPKGIYKGFDYDVYDLAGWVLLFVNGGEKDTLVYDIVKVVVLNKDHLKAVHPLGGQIDYLRKKIVDRQKVKVHPAAIKISKDMGEWEK